MVRVDLDADDVMRIRFSTSPAPLAETCIALDELRRAQSRRELRRSHPRQIRAVPGAGLPQAARRDRVPEWRRQWLDRAAASFPATARPLLELIPPSLPTPQFLDPLMPDLEEGLEVIRAAPRGLLLADVAQCWQAHASPGARPSQWIRDLADGDREARENVVRALRDFYQACVQPFWDCVLESFRADLAVRIPVLAAGGYARLFASLHPRLTWRDQGLEREGGSCRVALDGTGLQLFPSAFWSGPPAFAIRPREFTGNALFYAAIAPDETCQSYHDAPRGYPPVAGGGQPDGRRNLAVLLGHTRAEALRALQDPCGTAELAARLHVSASSASEHVAALRGTGLALTARHGRSVRHSLTSLGRSLLSAGL